MNNSEAFNPKQKKVLKDFLKISKEAIDDRNISPAYLLYLLSRFPDSNDQNIYTKVNKVLLRDTLPKKKRLFLDWISRK